MPKILMAVFAGVVICTGVWSQSNKAGAVDAKQADAQLSKIRQ